MTIQINEAIPANYRVPGIYLSLSYSTSGPSVPNKRVVYLGYRVAGAEGSPDQAYRLLSQSDADRYSGARGTDLSRLYAAGTSHLTAGSGVEFWGVPLEAPSAGVAATKLLWFIAPPVLSTSALDTNTAAAAPGVRTVWLEGYPVSVGVQQDDTFNTIAGNFLTALEAVKDYLSHTAAIIGETVTWGTGNGAFSVRALASPRYIVVTQQTGLTKTLTVNFDSATNILSIALGTDGAGAANTTGSALKTALDGIAGLSTSHIFYAIGGDGSGIVVALAQQLLPFRCVAFTARHKGLSGNDFPIRATASNTAMRIGISPGKLTFATNAAAAPGIHRLETKTKSFAHTPAAAATPSAEATAFAVAMNAVAFPLDAAYSSADVYLFYESEIANELTVSTTDSAQTIAFTDRISLGVLASTTASAGTPTTLQGQGTPTLTAALATLAADDPYLVWAHPFLDATTLGAIATHIERYQDSPYDKGQTAHVCTTSKLSVAALIPTSSTPRLTSSPRYVVSICPGAWEQAHEIAARTAALVAQRIDYPPHNYDGEILRGTESVPLHVPSKAEKMSVDDLQLAMANYYLTPIQDDGAGNLSIVSDATTWKPGDLRMTRWGGILTMDYDRDDLKAFLKPVVKGKNIKAYSEGYTPNTVTPELIRTAVMDWMTDKDKLDIYDGAALLFPQVQGQINPVNPSRYDLQLPMRWPSPLSVVGIKGYLPQR